MVESRKRSKETKKEESEKEQEGKSGESKEGRSGLCDFWFDVIILISGISGVWDTMGTGGIMRL